MTKAPDQDDGGPVPRERVVKSPYTARNPVNAKRGERHVRVLGPDGVARWKGPDGGLLVAIKEQLAGGKFEFIKPISEPSAVPVTTSDDAEEWKISERKSIRWTPRGVDLLVHHEKFTESIPVIVGHFRPMQQVDLDGDRFFRVLFDREVISTAPGLRKILDNTAMAVTHGLLPDVVSQVLQHFCPVPTRTHATFAAYVNSKNDVLELCLNPLPVYKEQIDAQTEIQSALGYTSTARDLEAYRKFLNFWHEYEVFPALGLSAIAPLAMVLRSRDIIVPHLFNWSPEHVHGVGKSLVAGAFSYRLWGRGSVPGDSLESAYRLSALFDAVGAPLWVEEAEHLDPKLYGAALKVAAERPVIDKRGTAELGMISYFARAILFLTGNQFNFTLGSHIVRFLAVLFDMNAMATRKARKAEADAAYRALRPVGLTVAKKILDTYPTAAELVARIRAVETEIALSYPGTFEDPRRAQVYAVVFVGLEAWAAAFKEHGIIWPLPSIQSFVENVIARIEASMWEGLELPAESFRSWLEMWIHKSPIGKEGIPRGKYDIWDEDEFEWEVGGTNDTVVLHGWYVTKTVLDAYNKEATPGLKIRTLKALAEMAATTWGIPQSEVIDKEGKPIVHRFGSSTRRSAFIPRDDEAKSPNDADQATLDPPARVYEVQKEGNRVTLPPRHGETDVTPNNTMLPKKVTSSSSMEIGDCDPVTRDGGQHPDFMRGLERALEVRRYDPNRPVPFIVGDLRKELQSKGHDPDIDQLTAGVIKGMMSEGS